MRILNKLFILLFIFFTSNSFAATELKDEGTSQGFINRVDCVGAGITCTRSGITGTMTVTGGGAGGDSVSIDGTATTDVDLISGDGITINFNAVPNPDEATFDLDDCAANEILKRNAGDTAWECAADGGGTVNTADIADVSVAQTELAELETIGTTTISAAQWTGLGGATTAGIALWDDANAAAQLVTLGLTATASEINTPLDGASVTLTEFRELETIGATTISANQWTALGGIAETLTSTELNLLDGITTLSGSNTGDNDEVGTLTTGDLCVNDGSVINCTVNTIVELETALDTEDILTATEGDAAYQPLEATLTDIADGTIAEDLVNTANPWADNEVADTITASNYMPLAGGTFTGAVVADEQGVEFLESDDVVTCAAGDYWLRADLSETVLKKCENGTETVMDTTGGTPSFSDITGATNTSAAMVVGTGSSLGVSGSGTITATDLVAGSEVVSDAEVADNISITNISQVGDITATALEINTPLDGALVTLTEFQELETIGATTISANQWAAIGGMAETLTFTELNLLDGITTLSGSNTGDESLSTSSAGIDVSDHAVDLDVTPSSGSATLEMSEDALQVKYDATLSEGASGLTVVNDHAESHTVASHSDTTATGAELETLTDGSDADSLHVHSGASLNDDIFLLHAGDVATGVHDFGGADSFEIPNSAAPAVNATGEIALDTTITSYDGLLKYYDGTTEMTIVAMPTADLTTTDNHVVAYASGKAGFNNEAQAGGGSGAFSDASDPVVLNTTSKDVQVGDTGIALSGKVEIGGDADQPQLVIEGHSTQTDSTFIIQQDDNTEVFAIEDDGTIKLASQTTQIDVGGDNPRRTAWIPASAMWCQTTTGCATDNGQIEYDPSTDKVNYIYDAYADGADSSGQFTLVLPESAAGGAGAEWEVEFYWTANSGTGTVAWDMSCASYSDLDTLNGTWAADQSATVDTLTVLNDLHVTEIASYTSTGFGGTEDIIQCRVTRDVSADTFNGEAWLLGVKIHFEALYYSHK